MATHLKKITQVCSGDKIVYANINSGNRHDQEQAEKYLDYKQEYTVKMIELDYYSTKIFLQEVPDIGFNSVLFSPKY